MRTTSAVARNHKKKRLFRKLKGYNKQSSYTMGVTTLVKAARHAYVERKLKKRNQRSLAIVRINAALRSLFNISYSKFMGIVIKNGSQMCRKVMAHMCFSDLDAFKLYAHKQISQANVNMVA